MATLQTDAKKGSDKVKKLEKMRADFFKWAFITAPILAAVGVLAYLLPALLTLLVIPLVVLICILCWAVIGVHLPVAVATADFCVDLDYALKHPNASMGAIDMVLKCGGKGGAANILATGDKFISQSYTKACTELTTKLCKTASFNYTSPNGNQKTLVPVTCPKIACNKQTLNTFLNSTKITDFKYGCAKLISGSIGVNPGTCIYTDRDVAKKQCLAKHGIAKTIPCNPDGGTTLAVVNLRQCAKSCHLSNTTRVMSNKIIGNYDILTRFDQLKVKRLEPLLKCNVIRAGVSKLEHTLCWKVVNATDYIIAGLAIIGITFFFGTAVYLGAQKVFNRKYWDVHYPDTYDKETSDDPDAETDLTEPILSKEVKTEAQ